MNCHDFGNIVNELAAYELMDAGTRETGRAHAAICSYCAARLSDAQAVNSGLLVAAGAETEEAPARIRQSLLAAFAAQHAVSAEQKTKEVEIASGVVIEISSWRLPRWVAVAGVAAAAVLLIALLLPSLLRAPRPAAKASASNDGPATPAAPATVPTPKKAISGMPVRDQNKTTTNELRNTSRRNPGRTLAMARKTPRFKDRLENNKTDTVARNARNDYFPLTYLVSSTAMESGTVVRIELSRSALISLGLPMSVEHANELVKADLVVGDDGVARAIRLVQE
jgi:hypothetical protein